MAAALDVEVAAAYGLGAERYGTVVGSFSPERARSWLAGRAARKVSVELRAYLGPRSGRRRFGWPGRDAPGNFAVGFVDCWRRGVPPPPSLDGARGGGLARK